MELSFDSFQKEYQVLLKGGRCGKHPAVCKLTDVDSDTGCKEFEIEKGRFSFWLTAPYREERRRAASKAAKNE